MPEFNVTHIVLLAVLATVGTVAGWFARGRRAVHEREALKTMWQEEIDRQRKEQKRLTTQNKDLMKQINQTQVRQSKLREGAAELSKELRELSTRRDALQRDIKSRDARIEALEGDLRNWQERVPPLIERFRKRNGEAEQLETKLAEALAAVRRLEEERAEAVERPVSIEPLRDTGQFTDGLEASNDGENEYVDEVDEEEMPVFIDESTMIESNPMSGDDQPEPAAETGTDDDQPVQAAEAESDDDQRAQAAEAESDDYQPAQAAEADSDDDQPALAAQTGTDDDQPAQAAKTGTDDAGDPAPDDADDTPQQRDNLKRIRGVGPAIEKTLNEMGIISYRQIADMTDYDIDRVGRRLKGFHGRIQSEDWVGQARTLLDKAALA